MTSAWTRRMNSLPSSWRQTDGPEDASGAATANVTPWGGEGRGSGRVQDQEARGVFKHCSGAHLCAHLLAYVCLFSPSVLPPLGKLTLCMYMCQR